MTLHEALAIRVAAWNAGGYTVENFPAIAEILEWAHGVEETGNVRFLRAPQLRALETYWYLRLVEGTPHVLELYKRIYTNKTDLLTALGLGNQELIGRALDGGVDALIDAVRTDDALVKKHKLEAVRETLSLDYPSYILALAMGAGKTILIGSIVATEFAMSWEYPDGPFVQNALVFAPGKTPIESLRELLAAPYDKILPPRMHRTFAASVKFTFTRDGEKDIPAIGGSSFNVVVTNTEKIRIQKEQIRKSDIGTLFNAERAEEARQDIANLRLQKIASLPHLAVFSDEAHHTYGQSLGAELKKVRKTVDYLHAETNVICVVNTTGTPYFERQPLRDVVIWYGLSQGIRDNILKDVSGNIQQFDFGGDTAQYLRHIVQDFLRDYRDVALPDGAPAKLAIYFPQTDDLAEYRPTIDAALAEAGISPTLVLVNTSDTTLTKSADIDAFNRLNDPAAPHRVMLLVNKGTEGWNCPSLFACALARKLRTSNNFVLQAASRCLRQVPGNTTKARIYLSKDNHAVLDRQLRETYGEEIADLNQTRQQMRTARVVLRKVPVAPLAMTQVVSSVVRTWRETDRALSFVRPTTLAPVATKAVFDLSDRRGKALQQIDSESIAAASTVRDTFAVATELSARYRVSPLTLHRHLADLYPEGEVPAAHVEDLARQLEDQTRHYERYEEHVERALAIVREEAFSSYADEAGKPVYFTEINYPVDRERYLTRWEALRRENPKDLGFHYDPIEFDSQPEQSFFHQVLRKLNVEPWEVEDIYFTGGLTDPAKTDFFVEYRTADSKWRRYTPDFIIRKKPAPGRSAGTGRVLIVEIKREKDRDDPIDGIAGAKARAVRRWEEVNPERVKYEMIFTPGDSIAFEQLTPVWIFSEQREVTLPLPVEMALIDEFCRKWHVAELAVFGSVLRPDFRPDSDVDFLVSFKPDAPRLGLAFFHMQEELKTLVGRDVDLISRKGIERSHNWIRRKNILGSARSIYVG